MVPGFLLKNSNLYYGHRVFAPDQRLTPAIYELSPIRYISQENKTSCIKQLVCLPVQFSNFFLKELGLLVSLGLNANL